MSPPAGNDAAPPAAGPINPRASADAGAGRPTPADPLGGVNAKIAKRQRLLLAAIGAVVLAGGSTYILSRSGDDAPIKPDDPVDVKISVDGLTGKKLAQGEWIARSENQIADASARVKALETQMPDAKKMSTDVAALQQENEKLKADGAKLFAIYEAQNTAQATRLKAYEQGGVPGEGGVRPSGAARWKQLGNEPFRVAGASPGGPGITASSMHRVSSRRPRTSASTTPSLLLTSTSIFGCAPSTTSCSGKSRSTRSPAPMTCLPPWGRARSRVRRSG